MACPWKDGGAKERGSSPIGRVVGSSPKAVRREKGAAKGGVDRRRKHVSGVGIGILTSRRVAQECLYSRGVQSKPSFAHKVVGR